MHITKYGSIPFFILAITESLFLFENLVYSEDYHIRA